MTKVRRCGLASALVLAIAGGATAAAPAQAAERFRVSLSGTWKTEGRVIDTTCYRLSDPESTDMIPFTGEFSASETGRFSTERTGTARAERENGRIEIDSYGRPLRLRLALDRRSDLHRECKPGENEDQPAPDCGAHDRRYGVGAYNIGAAMTFGFVQTWTTPIGGSETFYSTPNDPYRNCGLVELQDWLGGLGDEIGDGPDYGRARVSRTALMNRKRKTFVLRGFAEGHPRKDTRDEEGQGEVITVDYRLDWTLTLRRVSRRSRG